MLVVLAVEGFPVEVYGGLQGVLIFRPRRTIISRIKYTGLWSLEYSRLKNGLINALRSGEEMRSRKLLKSFIPGVINVPAGPAGG